MALVIADVSGLRRWWQDWSSSAPLYGIAIRVRIGIGQWALDRANTYLNSRTACFLPPLTLSTPTTFPHPLQPSTMPPQQTLSGCLLKLDTLISDFPEENYKVDSQIDLASWRTCLSKLRYTLNIVKVPFFLPCEGKSLTYVYPDPYCVREIYPPFRRLHRCTCGPPLSMEGRGGSKHQPQFGC